MHFLAALMALFTLCSPVSGRADAQGWYIRRTTDHTQPVADARFSYLKNYPAYYLDARSTEEDKVLYLTFDAGYENGNIARILDVLAEKGAVGSFFILQNLVYKNKDLLARMVQEGHLVCNHTAHHKDMTRTDRDAFTAELTEMEEVYRAGTGLELAKFYRPPEGRVNEDNVRWASEMGYKTVLWSFAYADWDNDKQPSEAAAKEKILAATHPGEIILLHPTSATNAAILGDLIDAWRADGYRLASLDALP